MIITVTGKPCSGKGTASKLFCSKYNFDYVCAGDIMRNIAAKKGYANVLEFQQLDPNVKDVDKFIDNQIADIGTKRVNDNLLIDSRLAWHFAKKSFKVFIDVDITTAGERLLNAHRENESTKNIDHAKQLLTNRWKTENDRYLEIYNIDNTHIENYDLMINSTNLTPEQIADIIYKNYKKFVKNAKN